jgi:DNA helicase II / ATP-dependent DNA helicase PcrA
MEDYKQSLLKGLNPNQKKAVVALDGPLLILAGAGSGKTKTLTHRIAYAIAAGRAKPSNVLAVTFTNKAANEMRSRVAYLLGQNSNDRSFMPFMGTFHGVCVRILRRDGELVGLDRNFVIFDESDRLSTVKRALKALRIEEKSATPRTITSIISNAKNELATPEELMQYGATPVQKIAAEVYPVYQSILGNASALDFDDLIAKTVELFSRSKEARQKWQEQFKYIMIDEYQDTNSAQYKLIKLLISESRNIAVVGDDWQSIYSWRGADFKNILNFEHDFPNATIIKLEQNYRSTPEILNAAHAVITKNSKRSDKKLWTDADSGEPISVVQLMNEKEEARMVASTIQNKIALGARDYGDFAVLYRTNAQSRALEEFFIRHNVPYKIVGGQRFYDRREIKDIIAYLRLIYQPNDVASFERVINVPTRGVGAKSLQKFYDWQSDNGYSLKTALDKVINLSLTSKALKGFIEVADIINSFKEFEEELALPAFIEKLISRLGYFDYLSDGTIQGETRVENVKELISVAKEQQDMGLSGFLEDVSLVSDLDGVEFNNGAVTLMTLHAAKGLEFPYVFMVGLEESIFPHSRALYEQSEMEEERRLCYVGMTRAQEELCMSYVVGRMLYGSTQYNAPSRFLTEIEESLGTKDLLNAKLESEVGYLSNEIEISDEPKYVEEFFEGDSVSHDVFGRGKVLAVDGDNIAVSFGGSGVKKLNVAFAPIKKL